MFKGFGARGIGEQKVSNDSFTTKKRNLPLNREGNEVEIQSDSMDGFVSFVSISCTCTRMACMYVMFIIIYKDVCILHRDRVIVF